MTKILINASVASAAFAAVLYGSVLVEALIIAFQDPPPPAETATYRFRAHAPGGFVMTDERGRPLEFDSAAAARKYAAAYLQDEPSFDDADEKR